MTFEEALSIVEGEFETRYTAPHGRAIRTHLTYDGFNGLSVELCDNHGEAVLTDGGITKDIFFEVENEDEWRELCEAHGFEFNRWNIERKFSGISDVYDYIDFLLLVCDKYDPLD